MSQTQHSELAAAISAVREALDVLQRASSEWRNGDARVAGPVHWSVAVPAAWQSLSRALRELEALNIAGSGLTIPTSHS